VVEWHLDFSRDLVSTEYFTADAGCIWNVIVLYLHLLLADLYLIKWWMKFEITRFLFRLTSTLSGCACCLKSWPGLWAPDTLPCSNSLINTRLNNFFTEVWPIILVFQIFYFIHHILSEPTITFYSQHPHIIGCFLFSVSDELGCSMWTQDHLKLWCHWHILGWILFSNRTSLLLFQLAPSHLTL